MNWLFLVSCAGFVLSLGYIVYINFFKQEYDEYVCKLGIVIWYNCDEQTVSADFSQYEKNQKVRVTICSVKTYQDISPDEQKMEGTEIYNDRALIRCAKGTYDPIAWWYLDQK